MPTFRFEPRDLCEQPRSFGRDDVTWKDVGSDPADWSRLQMAKIQHQMARDIRVTMRGRLDRRTWPPALGRYYGASYGTLGLYAVLSKTMYRRVADICAGRAPVRFEELLQAQEVTGVQWVAIRRDLREFRIPAQTAPSMETGLEPGNPA